MQNASILMLFGPTASGKSSAAIGLAQKLDGEIINADSMQVYAGLGKFTAIPDQSEQQAIPHHLYASIEGETRYSVAAWSNAALAIIDEIKERGKTPILVGGTGLYFDAMTKGLADIPQVSSKISTCLHAELASIGAALMHKKLAEVDPLAAARIEMADTQRLLRAMGVYRQTGKPISKWQQETTPMMEQRSWKGMVLCPPRQILYERINQRFLQMLDSGGMDELRVFLQAPWARAHPLAKAIGVAPMIAFIDELITFEDAVEQARRDSRRYAKRQMTWARNRMADWPVFEDAKSMLAAKINGGAT